MCNRGKGWDSCLRCGSWRLDACVEAGNFVHGFCVLCTRAWGGCVLPGFFARARTPALTHPGGKGRELSASFSHPLSTRSGLYPRKTSPFARFGDIEPHVGAVAHDLHVPVDSGFAAW